MEIKEYQERKEKLLSLDTESFDNVKLNAKLNKIRITEELYPFQILLGVVLASFGAAASSNNIENISVDLLGKFILFLGIVIIYNQVRKFFVLRSEILSQIEIINHFEEIRNRKK